MFFHQTATEYRYTAAKLQVCCNCGRTERKIAGHQKENTKNKENFKFNFFAFIIINYRSSDS